MELLRRRFPPYRSSYMEEIVYVRVTPIGSTFEFQPEHLGTFRYYQKSLKNTFDLVLALTETRGRPFEVEISQ